MNDKLFYIQDKRGYIGNSLMWWRIGGRGYTDNIEEAETFSESEARKLIAESPDKYAAWHCSYIDTLPEGRKTIIDMQYVDKRGKMANSETTRRQQGRRTNPGGKVNPS